MALNENRSTFKWLARLNWGLSGSGFEGVLNCFKTFKTLLAQIAKYLAFFAKELILRGSKLKFETFRKKFYNSLHVHALSIQNFKALSIVICQTLKKLESFYFYFN